MIEGLENERGTNASFSPWVPACGCSGLACVFVARTAGTVEGVA